MKQAAIAIAVCCAVFAALAYAQNPKPATQAKFVMGVSTDGGIAWRMDTTTGAMRYCLAQIGVGKEITRPAGCSIWLY